MKHYYSQFAGFLVILIVLLAPFACVKKSATPAYLRIENPTLSSNYATEGSNSNKILDAWVYVNSQPIGAYSLPCTIPIIAEGKTEILISPGILKNGIANTRIDYPYYQSYKTSINAVGLHTDTIHPSFKYVANAIFKILDDFETGSVFVKNMGDTSIMRTTNLSDAFEGLSSGVITFDATHDTCEIINQDAITYTRGEKVYVEMNYKNDMPITIGFEYTVGTTKTKYWAVTLNPKSTWNKVYIDLSDHINTISANSFKLLMRCGRPTGSTFAQAYFDNIKWICR